MTTPTPIEQPDKELRERVRALKLPDTMMYSKNDLTVGNLVDTSLEEQIVSLIESHTKTSDIRTLETISQLLNGDRNQVEVVKGYVFNKLKMYKEEQS